MMKAIILAAGKGTRMRSCTPKMLHHILGKPLIQYVPEACKKAGITDITIVVSGGDTAISSALGVGYKYATQAQPLGTGHAVQAAAGHINADDDVLILYGDMPLITDTLIRELTEYYAANNCAGVEATGMYIFKGVALLEGLKGMTANYQGELCLTDVPQILRDAGHLVRVFRTNEDMAAFTGVNTQAQLAEAAMYMRNRINLRHMENGVRMLDPATTYIDDTVEIATDVVLYPGCILQGACKIDVGAIIGPYTHMQDASIGRGATVRQSVLDGATIGANTTVGPFAHLRTGVEIGDNCRVGNYVEIKNAIIGDDTKMAHLAYIGDAEIGSRVNYSCGAITANYDGVNKHRTVIGDGAFIGCNANLVAPVEIGKNALVAAGSTITKKLPEYSMGIARAKQETKEDWVRLRKGL